MSKVRDFTSLFEKSRRKDFSGIESWETSHVTTMRKCFCGAVHFNENIESWNVSKVDNIEEMFRRAKSFNQLLDKWQVRSDCDVRYMFEGTPLENNPPKWYKERVDKK